MSYSQIIEALNNASLFELHRLEDRNGNELFGEVIKLNPKTAGVLVGTTRWKVGYGLLSSIIEGELGSETNAVEGQLIPGRLLGKQ